MNLFELLGLGRARRVERVAEVTREAEARVQDRLATLRMEDAYWRAWHAAAEARRAAARRARRRALHRAQVRS